MIVIFVPSSDLEVALNDWVIIGNFFLYLKNPWTDLPHILIGELGRPTGMFLTWF